MSINVTVSGNPVSIKRGKMVTADPYHAKKEFEKRRLLRLEQVRQQSKDIAEDVRNKVRKEKKKQKNEIEEEGKQKLRNWQNRKLLELQTQYKEALRELGAGHKEAEELEDENEVLAEQKEQNEELANHRGRVAATKLQIEKNKANFKKSIPMQQKKLVRDIENTRAALVSNIKKKKIDVGESNKKKRKKASADINITIPESDSDSEESKDLDLDRISEERFSNIEEEEEASISSCECTEDSENPRIPLDLQENELTSKLQGQESLKRFELGPTINTNLPTQPGGEMHHSENFRERVRRVVPPLDTRISDRIKRREIMASQLDYCDIVAETNPTPYIKSNTQIRDAIDSRYISSGPSDMCTCGKSQSKCSLSCGQGLKESSSKSGKSRSTYLSHRRSKESNVHEEIPTKPPIKLKQLDDQGSKSIQPSKISLESTDSHKVQFYDHPNRFSQEKRFPSNSHVEKITADSLEVMPNVISEAEWYEKMKQRDKEAQMRGQRALEKERIQKDYEDIVKKLPLLQKKERICEINKDKPEHHMSEERLKERERKKQNHLDNVYNKLFPNLKPAIVTLPSKKHDQEAKKSST
ncbi:hypothetical protein NQ314_004325 [Rhamnusium bicolor]|uniref:Uncharacterized protein n=1 Tax=Rhamnusium bicolor TaxID=1586634 RepID=A0AAV8ZLH0_9CUCU|nr:hypothetical protein NQ314_004325 [Rhamnusium bicolor]